MTEMLDISRCADHDCPSRDLCWRYIARKQDVNVYGFFDRNGRDECGYMWPITHYEEQTAKCQKHEWVNEENPEIGYSCRHCGAIRNGRP